MADSTLAAIRTKVRRLTRSPSEEQISTADIDEYVNTFIQYDFPQELRLFSFRTMFTFYTQPNVWKYETSDVVGDQLFNFKNRYTAVHETVYVAGSPANLVQDVTEFTDMYPMTNSIVTEAAGDGVTVNFAGTLSAVPVIADQVIFNAIDANNNGLGLHDDGAGVFVGDGVGTINYLTGAYTLVWNIAPAANTDINSLTIPYTAAQPDTIFYLQNGFFVRPIPDQVYPILIEVDMRPTELLAAGTSPELEQWWQYIAYGASKKIFEDRTDIESLEEILPEFKKQELLVLRRTIVTQSKERSSTIYSDGSWIGYGSRWGRNRT